MTLHPVKAERDGPVKAVTSSPPPRTEFTCRGCGREIENIDDLKRDAEAAFVDIIEEDVPLLGVSVFRCDTCTFPHAILFSPRNGFHVTTDAEIVSQVESGGRSFRPWEVNT